MNIIVNIIKKLLWALLILFILALVIMPFLPPHRARDKALDITCRSNLKQISFAIGNYMREHNETFPESLQSLVDNNYLKDDDLKCPLANTHGGQIFHSYKYKRIGSDYNYTQDINNPRGILCWDKAGNHSNKKIPDSINVLFKDGEIREFSATDLERQIQNYLESQKNDSDSGISYIYFHWHGLGRSSMPECLIYSDCPDNDHPDNLPNIDNSSWGIKVKSQELKKLGEILQNKLFKDDTMTSDHNSKYLVNIFYKGGNQKYVRLSGIIPDKQLQQDILDEIPEKEQWVLKQVFKNIQTRQ